MSLKGLVTVDSIHVNDQIAGGGLQIVLEYEVSMTLYLKPDQLATLAGMKDHSSRIVATLEEESR
jgi:hypothetical protein